MNDGDPVTQQRLKNIDSSISQLSGNLSSMTQALVQSNKATQKYMEQVVQEVQRTGQETVRHMKQLGEISCLIEINKQASQLEIIDPLIRKQANSLQTEYDRVQSKMGELLEQFRILFEELIETYQIDIRKLGSHIFEILENDYQRNIENRYYIGTYQKMESASRSIAMNRSGILSKKFSNFVSSIKNFFGLRDEFNRSISDCIIPLELSTDTRVEIPFWVIETSDESGATQYQIIFDQAINSLSVENGSQCSITFEPLSRFTDLNRIIDNMSTTNLMNNRVWQPIDQETASFLDTGIRTLVQEGYVKQDLKEHMNESIARIQVGGEVADIAEQRRTYSPPREHSTLSTMRYSTPGHVEKNPSPSTPLEEAEGFRPPLGKSYQSYEEVVPDVSYPETIDRQSPVYPEHHELDPQPTFDETYPLEDIQPETYSESTETGIESPEIIMSEIFTPDHYSSEEDSSDVQEQYTGENRDLSSPGQTVYTEPVRQDDTERDIGSKQVQCAHCHNDLTIEVYGDFICPYCHKMTFCNSDGKVFRTEREMKEEAHRW